MTHIGLREALSQDRSAQKGHSEKGDAEESGGHDRPADEPPEVHDDRHRTRKRHVADDQESRPADATVALDERAERGGHLSSLFDRERELLRERLGARGALRRVLCQTTLDQAREPARHRRANGGERRRRCRDLLREHFQRSLPLERQAPGADEERRGSQTVQVAARVDVTAEHLLRTHELRRTRNAALIGRALGGRDPEIHHQRPPTSCLDQDVVRLHVAMHESLAVRVPECPRDLAQHPHGLRRCQRPTTPDTLAERFAVDVRHHIEHESVDLVDREDRDDVRMRESRRHPCLANETLADQRVGGPRRRQ